jgi:hypothetical protein
MYSTASTQAARYAAPPAAAATTPARNIAGFLVTTGAGEDAAAGAGAIPDSTFVDALCGAETPASCAWASRAANATVTAANAARAQADEARAPAPFSRTPRRIALARRARHVPARDRRKESGIAVRGRVHLRARPPKRFPSRVMDSHLVVPSPHAPRSVASHFARAKVHRGCPAVRSNTISSPRLSVSL